MMRYTNSLTYLLTYILSQSRTCEQSAIVGNENNRSGSRGMQL